MGIYAFLLTELVLLFTNNGMFLTSGYSVKYQVEWKLI